MFTFDKTNEKNDLVLFKPQDRVSFVVKQLIPHINVRELKQDMNYDQFIENLQHQVGKIGCRRRYSGKDSTKYITAELLLAELCALGQNVLTEQLEKIAENHTEQI